MNTAAIRRRYYGGESAPVMEIIHPDAFYIKTKPTAGPNGSYIFQRGLLTQHMTKVIADGVESNNPLDYFVDNYNVNLNPTLTGAHEYYIYHNTPVISNYIIHSSTPCEILRFPRNLLIQKISRSDSNVPLKLILVSDATPNVGSLYMYSASELYVPYNMYDYYKENAIHVANIIPVKYKFIED